MSPSPAVAVSVVSHGHGPMVQDMLHALAQCTSGAVTRVVVTHNLPEPALQAPPDGWPFELQERRNAEPQGFSANHNAALADAREAFVCVLNPDVQWMGRDPFPALLQAMRDEAVGLTYPTQVDARGRVQDSEREVPTPWSLFLRYVFRNKEHRAEWVNAAFWLLRREAWQQVGGLDARYFMYCEDVDFCLRLRLAGWQLARASARVQHAGQRDSHRRWRHGLWHIRALLRLWCTPVFWRARPLLRQLAAVDSVVSDS